MLAAGVGDAGALLLQCPTQHKASQDEANAILAVRNRTP
jgi:hypothetical protein